MNPDEIAEDWESASKVRFGCTKNSSQDKKFDVLQTFNKITRKICLGAGVQNGILISQKICPCLIRHHFCPTRNEGFEYHETSRITISSVGAGLRSLFYKGKIFDPFVVLIDAKGCCLEHRFQT